MAKIKKIKPDSRYLSDMKSVLYDRKWAEKAPDFPVYYMYRGIKTKNGLRYDITELRAKMLGKEFPKTKGHRHPHQELYRVLTGEAIFLMQKAEKNKIKEVFAVKVKKGNFVVIPSNYDHIMINPLKKKLKTGNWLSLECKNDYSFLESLQGMCYFYLKDGWRKNRLYKSVPKMRFEKSLKKAPENLDFLKI